MGYELGLYDFVLFLHIVAVVVGFGPIFMNPVFGNEAKARKGIAGLAVAEANHKANTIAEYAIYAVPVLGLLLVWVSDGTWEYSDTWIWLSMTLYVVALAIVHAVLLPTEKRMRVLMKELVDEPTAPGGPPPQAVELEGLGKKMAAVGSVTHLMAIVLIFLMVFKPGA